MRKIVFAGLLGALLSTVLSAAALAEDDVRGKWFSTFEVGGFPQPVWITVSHLDHGKDRAARLTYSKPRDCFVGFEYGGEAGGYHVFYMTEQSGSYCYQAYARSNQSTLRVRLSPDANLIYEMMVDGKALEKGLLKRS